ncbi:MAG TPA: D-alanyl-D-alanine carboxypeptidase/D-alanyl-D-alanine-endopeptidase [Nocardioidaceae bacterium]|nr:D-alanyl-D-alanine carboxypeptidase/D-alanyl-D-alanine-endopeptidase [Nocardioidaceae bacterium]
MRTRAVVLASAMILLAALGLGGWVAYDEGLLDPSAGEPQRTAGAELPPPPGVSVPEVAPPGPVLEQTSASTATRRGMRTELADELRADDLGPSLGVLVEDLASGDELLRHGRGRFTPASTLKLLTAVAVLEQLGPEHRFSTTVVAGRRPGEIVLVGGGDPLLARRATTAAYPDPATTQQLARRTAKALAADGTTRVRLRYDASLFTGPAVNPAWEPSYVPDQVVTPISALWVDEGLGPDGAGPRATEPARAAAEVFADQLEAEGIVVRGRVTPREAPAEAQRLASVESPPLARIVGHVLQLSDNEGAEVLLRHVALAAGRPASFEGGVQALTETLAGLGIDLSHARILGGSGLARGNRLPLDVLVDTLRVAAQPEHPELRAAVSRLPVAGFSGSLAYRFAADGESPSDPALGVVRAKTGTLTGVHALAGVILDQEGAALLYVAIADQVRPQDTLDARAALDDLSAAIATCGCG